jgi:hypothetical protein
MSEKGAGVVAAEHQWPLRETTADPLLVDGSAAVTGRGPWRSMTEAISLKLVKSNSLAAIKDRHLLKY